MCSGQRLTRAASLLLGLVLFSTSACGDGGPTEPDPVATTISVTPGTANLEALGSTTQFSAAVRDQSGQAMSGISVNWSSSNPSVASVSSNGLATAASVGSTTITATAGSAFGNASLTVTQVATSVLVSPSTHTMTSHSGTVQLTAAVKDANSSPVAGAVVNWTSSDAGCVQITQGGLATAGNSGTATITATSGGASGTAVITVLPPPVATVAVTPAQGSILVGATLQFTAVARDASGNVLSGRALAWVSQNPSVASVDGTGLVTGNAVGGPVTITATSEGKTGTSAITVIPPPVATVEVTPAQGSVLVGSTIQLTAVTKDASGNVLNGKSVSWVSQSHSLASVDGNGLVTGVAAGGPVTITAMSEGKTGAAQITVVAPVASVVVSGKFRVKVGDTYTYTATARLADGTVVVRPISWGVAAQGMATMTPDGHLTPLQAGTITLQLTIDGVVWETTATAYDWTTLSASGNLYILLDADVLITNKWGTSEYPELVFVCSSEGKFFAWVNTEYFVTASGLVAYSFDGGQPLSQTWVEFDNYSALGHPGPTNLQTKAFAATVASSRIFGFAFTEFNASAKATLFRVTGMSQVFAPLLAACPSNSLVPEPQSSPLEAWSQLRVSPEISEALRAERQARAEVGPQVSQSPDLTVGPPLIETRMAERRR